VKFPRATRLVEILLHHLETVTKILIVYHSQTGNTEKMARVVAEGAACVEGMEAILKQAGEMILYDLLAADGLVIGKSAPTKALLDQCCELGGHPCRRLPFRDPLNGTGAARLGSTASGPT